MGSTLVYAAEHGHLQLAALEYVVLKSAWDQAHGKNAPRGCMGTGSISQPFGLPTFYSSHAWILKHNPADTGTPPLVANAVTR